MNEEIKHLLTRLGDQTLQQVVLLKMEGHSPGEIAIELGTSERTIQRKLALICCEWEKELAADRGGSDASRRPSEKGPS